jgi:hypothetical protein
MNVPDNPYAVAPPTLENNDREPVLAADGSMVNQVMVIGSLQIVLGALELLMGAGLLIFAFFMSDVFAAGGAADDANMPSDNFVFWMQAMYGGIGGVLAFFAAMRIVSGIAAFWFRWRGLMITSLICGLCSALTFYCAPMSIGLAIYGLVVMLNSGVAKAYRLGRQGMPAAEIRRQFR